MKTKKLETNLLKAPSRHKKFFHQIFVETFYLKMFLYFDIKAKLCLQTLNTFFNKLNKIFVKFGSNTLTRIKFLLNCPVKCNSLMISS